jgi:glutathione S-transferase
MPSSTHDHLHYHPGNASFAPHVLLHELGVPFDLQRVDRAAGAHKFTGLPAAEPQRADTGAGGR